MGVVLHATCQQIITPPLVAVGALAGAVLAVLGAVYLFTQASDSRLTFKQGEQYYTEPATAAEANGVGELLMQSGNFSDGRATSVHVGPEEGAYQIKYVINSLPAADPIVS